MSEPNVELGRRFNEAFNARDIDAIVALCDPTFELHLAFGAVGTVYRGHDGTRRWHKDLEEAWGDEIHLEPEAYFDLGEHGLGFVVLHARGSHSGVDVTMSVAQVARWRDGLLVYAKIYVNREDALRDLGVSEHELEPIEP